MRNSCNFSPAVTTTRTARKVNSQDEWLSRLVETQGSLVWRTISRLLGADDGVDDCFQETFLELMRLANKAQIQHPAALLVRIATRRAIDRIRQRSADRRTVRTLADGDAAAKFEPLVAAIGAELAEALRAALATLPEQQSAVFVMTQLEHLSHDDAAAALGVRLNHVAVLLFRARTALQMKLKNVVTRA
jgi:RNA polymerase sigma-70 factor, ECF subfamily